MMADLLSNFPAALGAWAAQLLDVSWQAGLVAGGAWLLCRLCPRMPAHVRAMLWWLVCAKFLVGLAWTHPVGVPLLPAPSAGPVAVSGAAHTRVASASWLASVPWVGSAPSVATTQSVASAPSAEADGWLSARTANRAATVALGGIWICGLLLQLARTYRAYRRTRALIDASEPADASVATLAHALSRRVGVNRVAVRVSASIDTPRLTGAFTPIILLPSAADQLSRTDLEMTLCHELLHVRRGDLCLGWLPSAAQCVFFFHPCVWMATREYALAREAACDAAVLRVLGAEPEAYGALLLRLGVAHAEIAPAAVGASSSFRTLERRLIMLQNASEKARAHAARWWMVAAAIGITVVPLRLVARTPAPFIGPAPTDAQVARDVGIGSSSSGRAASAASSPSVASSPSGASAASSAPRATPAAIENGDGDAWVLLKPGNHVTMNGSTSDIQEARRQRRDADEALVWFRHDGKTYVIRDPTTLEAVQALFAPMQRLGSEQGMLGDRQGELGAQQGKLGDQQGRLCEEMASLSSKLNELTADHLEIAAKQLRNSHVEQADMKAMQAQLDVQMQKINQQIRELSQHQEALGRQQEALGREQETLGRGQERLGRQQGEAAKAAERALREIFARAIEKGLAQPAR